MKILVIAESINVEDSSASKVNLALINNLIKAGFKVKVYHYSFKEILIPSIPSILIKENKISIWYILSRIQSVTQKIFKINFNSSIESFLGFSFAHSSDTSSIVKAIKADKDFSPDLVLTLSKGGSFRPHRALLKIPYLHSKWIAYIHDPYPFHYYPRPYNWVEKSYAKKQQFFENVFSEARHISYPSKLLMEWMESYFEVGKGKGFVIPHQIGDESAHGTLPDYFTVGDFNLLHAGNLLKQRNPEFLIKAFLLFLEKNPKAAPIARLILIGPYNQHDLLLNSYKNHSNIIIKSNLDYNSVKLLEAKASVNIILEAVSEISPFLPGKFPNLVVANRPILVLSPNNSEVKRLLGNDYPFWSEADDINEIQKLIEKLFFDHNNNEKNYLNRPDLIEYCSEVGLKKIFYSQFKIK